jgi:hypothetical protein
MKLAVMSAATVGIALTCSPAHAHHSHFYDECKTTTIEGHVESAAFKNPHNVIVLRLDDGTAFAVDWVNVTWLTRAGVIDAAKGAVGSVNAYKRTQQAEVVECTPLGYASLCANESRVVNFLKSHGAAE